MSTMRKPGAFNNSVLYVESSSVTEVERVRGSVLFER